MSLTTLERLLMQVLPYLKEVASSDRVVLRALIDEINMYFEDKANDSRNRNKD